MITTLIIFIASFLIWYILTSANCALNGAYLSPTRPIFIPFQQFWQDMLFALPGGTRRRGQYIKDRMEGTNGYMISTTGAWSFEEIRNHNLYNKVGKAMLPGPTFFILHHLCILFGPTIICILAQ